MYRFGLLFFIVLYCTGCMAQANMDGIIIDVDDDSILLARDMSVEQYEDVKDLDPTIIQNNDVNGDTHYGLIVIQYEKELTFEKGDYVEIWLEGDIMNSYPGQASAKQIKIK